MSCFRSQQLVICVKSMKGSFPLVKDEYYKVSAANDHQIIVWSLKNLAHSSPVLPANHFAPGTRKYEEAPK